MALVGRTARLIWTTHRDWTAFLLVAVVGQRLVPVGRLWVGKLIIDGLVAALAAGTSDLGGLLPLVIIEFVLTALGATLATAGQAAQAALGHLLRTRVGEAVLRVSTRLDYAVLEDPAFHDRLQRAQREASFRPLNLLMQLSYSVTGVVGLVGILALLGTVHVLAPVALVALGLPYVYVQARSGQFAYFTILYQSADARRLAYLGGMTSTLDAAKEVRLFGLADYLLGAYRGVAQRLLRQTLGLVRYQSVGSALTALLATAGYFGAYLYFLLAVLARRLSLGDLTVYTGAFLQGGMQVQAIAAGVGAILENGLFLRDLFAFLDLDAPPGAQLPAQRPPIDHGLSGAAAPDGRVGASGIVFDKVHFRYPSQKGDTLQNVSLVIPRGSVAALVGENGAGKTTLIKLLCRLYEPTAGRILLDGTDIRERDPAVLRTQFGVLFQDFVRYHLTVRENIGFGDAARLDDLERVREVARRAGADAAIAALPQQYETLLGKMFDEGHELSGGEWQRVALARAYMRDAPILILDEPTASLDPRAEQRIFEEVRRLLAGRTAIIISHRFSTVRLADQIYVLHEGRVVEQGTHESLMGQQGRYAELYELQAAAYR